nr:hypothetical protein [Bacteroidota bacterium]
MLRKISVFILFVFVAQMATSQTVEVLNKPNKRNLTTGYYFDCLHVQIDTTKLVFMATLKATGEKNEGYISALYTAVKQRANELGANCFSLRSYTCLDDSEKAVLIVDAYYANDSILTLNENLHAKNIIYIFSTEKWNDALEYNFKINENIKSLHALEYCEYKLSADEKATLYFGKNFIIKEEFEYHENREAKFVFVPYRGSKLKPEVFIFSNGIYFGVQSKRNKLSHIENSLGWLLVCIFHKAL